MTTPLRSTCSCTSAALLRAGVLVCASCGAPIVGSDAGGDIYTSHRPPPELPPGKKGTDMFNRACRSNRVAGAVKKGRVWSCSAEAWRARADAPTPAGLPARKPRKTTTSNAAAVDVSDDLLAELGARRAG